ncbi:MAG: hypothetical protein R2744_09970, partial [Bacteroidales bacterium]
MLKRHEITIEFTKKYIDSSLNILDLGFRNDLSEILERNGYNITNTGGEDLDIFNNLKEKYGEFDVITAFEILEHLVSPFE